MGHIGQIKRKIALALTGVLFTLALCTDGNAQTRGEKLRVVYSAIGSSQSPLWIAHEAGIFKKHGLDVELLYVAAGSRAKSARAESSPPSRSTCGRTARSPVT
jgi:ABC-type nitrate/sulfonate/bicarbonate transport system substrate-binding protein